MMPMADIFAPDINIVPARSVYPTMRGGTTAGAGGAMTTSTSTVVPDPTTGGATPTVSAGSPVQMSGNTVYWWLGALALLGLLVFVARKVGGPDEFRNIRPSVYNVLTITLTAIIGIVGLKVLAAKFRIPGASDIILAV